jgi:hypothetical protein
MANNTRLDDIAATVRALQVIVEMLLVDSLAEDDNPKFIGDEITKSAFATEEKVRDQISDSEAYAMKITEIVSSMKAYA